MAFQDIFLNIFAMLEADSELIPGLLGPKVPQNMRLYRRTPQIENKLSSYEPNQPAEGWLIVEESTAFLRLAHEQFASNHEYMDIIFHVYATTYALTHAVLDRLDILFHWEVESQRDVQWGERWLLFTRRAREEDQFEEPIKMYHKSIRYSMEFVREEAPAYP